MLNFGQWIKFNEVNRCGINIDVENSKEIAKAINYLKYIIILAKNNLAQLKLKANSNNNI